jgi:hypothetical protein
MEKAEGTKPAATAAAKTSGKMVTAYDIKNLVERYKAKGLDIGEDVARELLEETFDWLTESAEVSSNSYDNVMAVMYPVLKKEMLVQVDKIDCKVG